MISEFDGRDVPFVMRVAAEWIEFSAADDVDDGAVVFRDRAVLTGALAVTREGHDVEVSDIGMSR
ncbi:MAG: hypothetical protein ABS81_14115 [Pseudonocardia sp. SCN 72-86]|nr:MAG: hypothetical protein ABS81_14115 [Pseudonocardia sp. SCN 72-86]